MRWCSAPINKVDKVHGVMTVSVDVHPAVQPVVLSLRVYKEPEVNAADVEWSEDQTYAVHVHHVQVLFVVNCTARVV